MLNTRLVRISSRFSTCLLLGLTLSVVGPPLLAPCPAHAMTVVLDQSHTAGTGATGINAGGLAQTFTVGVSGILDSIEIELNTNSGGGSMDILTTSGGVPTSTVLASAALPEGTPFVLVDLSGAGLSVTANDVLAFAIYEANETLPVSVVAGFVQFETAQYPDGAVFKRATTSDLWTLFTTFEGADTNFRSFVQPIPEPSTGILLGCGLLALETHRRRRALPG